MIQPSEFERTRRHLIGLCNEILARLDETESLYSSVRDCVFHAAQDYSALVVGYEGPVFEFVRCDRDSDETKTKVIHAPLLFHNHPEYLYTDHLLLHPPLEPPRQFCIGAFAEVADAPPRERLRFIEIDQSKPIEALRDTARKVIRYVENVLQPPCGAANDEAEPAHPCPWHFPRPMKCSGPTVTLDAAARVLAIRGHQGTSGNTLSKRINKADPATDVLGIFRRGQPGKSAGEGGGRKGQLYLEAVVWAAAEWRLIGTANLGDALKNQSFRTLLEDSGVTIPPMGFVARGSLP